jgi:glycosyltransferase involved in cell wall biosynthesis
VPLPAASVVIPARDAAATLPATLAALAAQDVRAPFEVWVVDDGSRDATARIAAAHPVVTGVLAARGDGPGAARNLGIEAASAPVVAFTDADCAPDPGWLRAGLDALAAGADLAQGRVVADGAPGRWDRTVRVDGLSGLWETANLFVRTDALRAVGGFEPWLEPWASKELGEDVWLGWRLHRAGARVTWAPAAVVSHAVHPGTAATWVAERARLRFFPVMSARIPELRVAFLWRRRFLSPRSAAMDLALVAA